MGIGEDEVKRVCQKCGHSIRRSERFHFVRHRFLGFLWFVRRPEHHSCLYPHTGPEGKVKRLVGEIPFPFPEEDLA